MLKQLRHARACTFATLLSAVGTLYAAPSTVVTSADAPVPAADYQSIFNTYKPLTEDVKTPDNNWRAANDAVAAEPMGGMQMGGGAMAMPMGESKNMPMGKETGKPTGSEKPMSMQMPMKNGMTMPANKEKPVKKSASKPMKMPMEKGMSMDDMQMGEKMPPMDMRKGMGK